ncbi:MAG: hypothetical protein AB8B87_15555 [Granulosicoccus sp.]
MTPFFDFQSDPEEVIYLSQDPAFADRPATLKGLHFEWTRQHHNRITRSASIIEKMTDGKEPPGIFIEFANKDELAQEGLSLPKHADR